MHKVEESMVAIKELVQGLPSETYTIQKENRYAQIFQSDDYPVLWELQLAPVNPNACPFGLFISTEDDICLTYGLMFDNREKIGARLGLRVTKWSRHMIGFGTEPVRLSLERVLQILSSVLEGQVLLRWTALGGVLLRTAGEVATATGVEKFTTPGGIWVSYFHGEIFQYEPWGQRPKLKG